jgi:rSAM/selenodomain-associated transferase 2
MTSKLSIVMPCLNEAAAITTALGRLQAMRGRAVEVIVVDGGSIDATAGLAAPLADRVIVSPRGRAAQMNAGAAVSRGDILLFLHADCALPPTADRLVIDGLSASRKRWGRFDIALGTQHWMLPVVAFMMNVRSRVTGVATGDQGIFVQRNLFFDIGGFPALPLMEDVALCKRLRATSSPLCLRERLSASPRRWQRHGVLRTIVLMWRLRLAFFLGANPVKLARVYATSYADD